MVRRPWWVIAAWLILVAVLSVTVTPLMKLASDRNQELLPANSAVMAATRELYPQITATDARGFYRHAGYFPPESAEDLMESARQFSVTEPINILKNFVARYAS